MQINLHISFFFCNFVGKIDNLSYCVQFARKIRLVQSGDGIWIMRSCCDDGAIRVRVDYVSFTSRIRV